MRSTLMAMFLWVAPAMALAQAGTEPHSGCGEVVTVQTHDGTRTRYALAGPVSRSPQPGAAALVVLVGGSGYMDLDERGCARMLKGNSLLRQLGYFHEAGVVTAVVDAPSDRHGQDGLAEFRVAPAHAQDIGKVIADVRARTQAQVWVVGTSRGSISAVNAASRLSGAAAPEGVVITSVLGSGAQARKAWVMHTVFDLPLEAIRVPVLVVGHAADRCPRSPASLMDRVTARTEGVREQVVTVTGGPGVPAPGVDACEGKSPHGFTQQEAEVAAGIIRFVRGGQY